MFCRLAKIYREFGSSNLFCDRSISSYYDYVGEVFMSGSALATRTDEAQFAKKEAVSITKIDNKVVLKTTDYKTNNLKFIEFNTLVGTKLANGSTLGTYDLSGYDFKGMGLYYSHENFRDARTGSYHWKYQTVFSGSLGYAELGNNTQIAGLATYQWSGYHPFTVNSRLKLLAGVQIQLEGGALYIPNNGNNPVSLKLRTALAATGMAIYHFPV